ncbi:MAG: hypothetical protein ACE5JS_06085 [Nitrospinota bacterium]
MKSALELAMEKTTKFVSEDRADLSEEQKKRIGEIEGEFRAKVAEAEIMRKQKIREIHSEDPASAVSAAQTLREEFLKDKEAWESKKIQEIERVKGKKA